MIVFKKTEDLIDYTFCMTDSTDRYPKKVRFTYTNRIQNLVLDFYHDLLYINELDKKDRKNLQRKVLSSIKMLLFLIKLSYSKNFIDSRQMEIWTEKVNDVKNLTAAWMHRS